MTVKSPLKYHGGKSQLAKKIIDLMPDRDDSWTHFHEPYFGGGSVTFAINPEGLSESVNDVDGELMNFWRVIAHSDCFDRFSRLICFTPFAEEVFDAAAFNHKGDDAYRAAAFFIRNRQSRQGLGKDFGTPTKRLRRGMNENVSAWLSVIEGLPEVHERLKRIEVRCMDAIDFIKKYDHEKAVFYLDPPYLFETRSTSGGEYKHEMDESDHELLLRTLSEIRGRFLLSGYRSFRYDTYAESCDWNRTDIKIPKSSSSKKTKDITTECIWRNFK